MKRLLLLAVSLVSLTLYAQKIGSWTVYSSYHNVTDMVPDGDEVYALSSGAFYMHDTKTGETRFLTKADILSGSAIRFASYVGGRMLLVYEDSNIDLLDASGNVTNLPQLAEKDLSDKTVTDVSVNGRKAYLATSFGVLVVNAARGEFAETYNLDKAVTSVAASDTCIYLATSDGIYSGSLKKNLLDKSNWVCRNTTFKSVKRLLFFSGKLFALTSSGLYTLNPSTCVQESELKGSFTHLNLENGRMIVGHQTRAYIFTSATGFQMVRTKDANCIVYAKGSTYWQARKNQGIEPCVIQNDSLVATAQAFIPNSPIRNYFTYMDYTPQNRLLVAGGIMSYPEKTYEGTLMAYEDGRWTNFQEEGIVDKIVHGTDASYTNLTSLVEDPDDPTHHFATSKGHGVFEFRNGQFVNNYTYHNSTLPSILPNSSNRADYVRTMGATFDGDGNLWVLATEVDTVLHVRQKNGTWKRVYLSAMEGNPTMDRILFDQRGWIWINSRRETSISQSGLFCMRYNGNLSTVQKCPQYFVGGVTNSDGVKYNAYSFFCFTQDRNGYIWVGTDQGLFVIDNPEAFGSSAFRYTQPKIARNDGSGYADYLLANIPVTAIAFDAAGRMWVGTSGYGVYLISADYTQQLQHFTTSNSPLLSDFIASIAINGQNGEVMFGTESGLVSYISDATTPTDKLDKDDVEIYPNPITSDYTGVITVRGLSADCDVKIATADGRVVYHGTSNGGTFTWNGRSQNGSRLAAGVYMVLASQADGEKGVVGRITLVR